MADIEKVHVDFGLFSFINFLLALLYDLLFVYSIVIKFMIVLTLFTNL